MLATNNGESRFPSERKESMNAKRVIQREEKNSKNTMVVLTRNQILSSRYTNWKRSTAFPDPPFFLT